MIGWATSWPEAVPVKDISAESVATVFFFFTNSISRYRVPAIITTDGGRQFWSSKLDALLGVEHYLTSAYHPLAKGKEERWCRWLIEAVRSHRTERWVDILLCMLLGLQASCVQDSPYSPAELLHAQPLTLPREILNQPTENADIPLSVWSLRSHFKKRRLSSRIRTFFKFPP